MISGKSATKIAFLQYSRFGRTREVVNGSCDQFSGVEWWEDYRVLAYV